MKNIKILSIILGLAAVFGLNSCEDYEPGGTPVEAMSGEWVAYSPVFDASFVMQTANTSANEANKLTVTDAAGFWNFSVKADCDVAAKTFSCTDVTNGAYNVEDEISTLYDIKVSIRGGQITEKAVELPSGVMADKIEFEILFSDIEPGTRGQIPAGTYLKIVGYRFTGFSEDDDFIYTGE